MKKIKNWVHNLSLVKKIFYTFSLVGLLLLSLSFGISMLETYRTAVDNYRHVITLNYNQTVENLTHKLKKMDDISTVICTNQYINNKLNRIYGERDYTRQYIEFQDIRDYLDTMDYSGEFSSMNFLLENEYNKFQYVLPSIQNLDSIQGRRIQKTIERNGRKSAWFSDIQDKDADEEAFLSVGRVIPNLLDYEQQLGILTLNLRLEEVKSSFISSLDQQIIYLQDRNGNLIVSNDNRQYDRLAITRELEQGLGPELREITLDGRKYFAMRTVTEYDKLEVITLVPQYSIRKEVRNNALPLIIYYISACLGMLVIILWIAKSISRRISLLSHTMLGVREGRLDTLETEEYHDEVGELISNYNYMVHQIRELLEQQFQLGEEKRMAELKALQAQINPHFLYNTLDMINWMAIKNEKENIQQTVLALAQYYKLTLSRGEDIITIGEEIRLCQAYISIQQMRFRGKIQFVVDVDQGILSYRIPKITLQPLVENAIVHGIAESSSGRGRIIISGWEENETDICLSVTDDGVGMKGGNRQEGGDGQEPLSSGSRYGIANIEHRLCLFYNIPKCITFDSVPGMGTCVSLAIKKRKQEKKDESIDCG